MNEKNNHLEIATFAGGCFWCVASDFEKLGGVKAVVSGYAGGRKENPTYEEVSGGGTGHLEVAQVHYDPQKITYRKLVEHFFRHVDPTDPGGQFADRGPQYRTAVFYHDETQKQIALDVRQSFGDSGRFARPIVTDILPMDRFYPAEAYHQDYFRKNALHYKMYRTGSGRDHFLKEIWGKGDSKAGF
ncbi:MAG: peptide-methionine (S)-S-oxide reductase MsrA [Proteobacteria bacterium]|nr:peptide-methionine (S)-S-oxide reductase MsrA [Pseudomonadota bacterium]